MTRLPKTLRRALFRARPSNAADAANQPRHRVNRWAPLALAAVLVSVASATKLHAQVLAFPVFDISNYIQDLIQVEDLAAQLRNMVLQAQMLPINMVARYRVVLPQWGFNLQPSTFLTPVSSIISSLNAGDASGFGYKQVVDPLDLPSDVLSRMPLNMQRRLANDYATIQLADSISSMTIDQAGSARVRGNPLIQVLESLEADAFTTLSGYNTQTALLNKINSASVVGLKEEEQTNQFLSSTVEQLLVDNKRKRDTEAKLMNATINQWRYGTLYGQSLFSRTAFNINTWRLP